MAIKYPNRIRTDIERQLHHKKANKVLNGRGVPKDNEGVDGDIRINSISNGIKLYAKYNNRWYGVKLHALRSESSINKLLDATGGTVSDTIDASGLVAEIKGEFASLVAKINEILDRID